MELKRIVEQLGLKVFNGEELLERDATGGYVSDLLSDVMGNAPEGSVWITLQAHMNVMAIACLKEISAVILVKDIVPAPAVIEKAKEEGVILLGTSGQTFETAGALYSLLNGK